MKESTARKNYSDIAYDFIKKQILNFNYKPNQTISEQEIASKLDISRTPVREALRRLTIEGLLEKESSGYTVYSLTSCDLKEIFIIKEMLESYLVREAAKKRTEKDLSQLKSLVEKMEKAVSKNDINLWLRTDVKFHNLLFDIVGNKRIEKTINSLNEQWHRLKISFIALEERIGESTKEHKQIYSCLEQGDGETAGRVMQEHLENVRKSLLDLIENFLIPYLGENL